MSEKTLLEMQQELQRIIKGQEVSERVKNAQKRENILKKAGASLALPATAMAMFGAGGHAYQQKNYISEVNETPPPIVYEIEDQETLNRLSDSYSPYNFIKYKDTQVEDEPINSIKNVLSKDSTFNGYGRANTPGLSAEERNLINEKLSDAKNYFNDQNKKILEDNKKNVQVKQTQKKEKAMDNNNPINDYKNNINTLLGITLMKAYQENAAEKYKSDTLQNTVPASNWLPGKTDSKVASSITATKISEIPKSDQVEYEIIEPPSTEFNSSQNKMEDISSFVKIKKSFDKKGITHYDIKPKKEVPPILKQFGTSLKNASQSIARGISQVAGATLETAKRGAQAAVSVVQKGAEKAIDTAGTIAEGAVNIAENVVDGVVDIGKETVNIAGDVAREVVGTAGDVAREAARAGGRVVDGAVNIAENTAKTAGRIVEGAANTGYAILKNASDGMLYGAKGAVDILKDISGNYQQRLNVRNYYAEQRETDIVRQQQYRKNIRSESRAFTKAEVEKRKTDDNQTKNTINIINAEAEANAKAHEQARLTSQQKREDAVAVIKANEESKEALISARVQAENESLNNKIIYAQRLSDVKLDHQQKRNENKLTAEALHAQLNLIQNMLNASINVKERQAFNQSEVEKQKALADIEINKARELANIEIEKQEKLTQLNEPLVKNKMEVKPAKDPMFINLQLFAGDSDEVDNKDDDDTSLDGFDKDFLSARELARKLIRKESLFNQLKEDSENLGVSFTSVFKTKKIDENGKPMLFYPKTYISSKMGTTLLNILDAENGNKSILSLIDNGKETPFINIDKSILSKELIEAFNEKGFESKDEHITIPVESCMRTNSKVIKFKIQGSNLAVNIDAKNIYFTLTDNENKVTHVHQPAKDSVFDFQINPELVRKTLDKDDKTYFFMDKNEKPFSKNTSLVANLDPKELLALAKTAPEKEGVRIFNEGGVPSIFYTTIKDRDKKDQEVLILKISEDENYVFGNFGNDKTKDLCYFRKVDSVSLIGRDETKENKTYDCGLVFNSELRTPLEIHTNIYNKEGSKKDPNDLTIAEAKVNNKVLKEIVKFVKQETYDGVTHTDIDDFTFSETNEIVTNKFDSSNNYTDFFTRPDKGREFVIDIPEKESDKEEPTDETPEEIKEPTNLVVDNNIEGFDKDFLSNRVLERMELNDKNLFEKISINEKLGISYSTIFRTLKKDENDNQIEFEQNTYISNNMGSALLNVLDPKNENKKILSLSEDKEKTPYITVDKSVLSAELIKLFEDKNFASTEESIEIPVETCIRTNSKIMSFKIEGTDLAVNVDAKNIYFTLTDKENKVTHVHQPAQDSVFDFQLNPEFMAKTLDQENNKYLFLDHKGNSYLDNKDLILDLDPKELLALAMSEKDVEGVRIFNNGKFPSILYTTITNTNNEEQKILIVKTGEDENFVYGNFGLDENKDSCAFKKVDSISLVGEEFNSENKNYNCGLVFNSEDKPLIIDTQIASNQIGKDRENDLQYDQIKANYDKLELIKSYIKESNDQIATEENSDPNEIRFGKLNFANINTDSIESFNSSLNHTEYYTKPDEGKQAVDEIAKPEVELPKPDVDDPSKGEPEVKEPPAQPKPEKSGEAEKSLKDTWGPAGLLLMAVGVIFMLLATILGAPFAFIGVSALVVGAGVKVVSNVKFSDSAKLNKAVDEQLKKKKREKKENKKKQRLRERLNIFNHIRNSKKLKIQESEQDSESENKRKNGDKHKIITNISNSEQSFWSRLFNRKTSKLPPEIMFPENEISDTIPSVENYSPAGYVEISSGEYSENLPEKYAETRAPEETADESETQMNYNSDEIKVIDGVRKIFRKGKKPLDPAKTEYKSSDTGDERTL